MKNTYSFVTVTNGPDSYYYVEGSSNVLKGLSLCQRVFFSGSLLNLGVYKSEREGG